MAGVSYTAALLLAGVFAWAGVAKLRRPAVTGAGLRRLGLPAPRVLAVAVPVVELAVAAALVVAPRSGGALALGLLAVFSGLLAARLRAGATVGCGCFGGAARTPLSVVELLRNALLAVCGGAAFVAAQPVVPPLEAVVVTGAAAALGVVTLALADLRARAGALLGLPADLTAPEGPR